MEVRIGEITAYLGKLTTIKELVLSREKVGGSDEILNGGDDGFTIAGGDKVFS